MRDFVSVHDVVQANLLAMHRSEGDGMALNIGSGHPISIGDVAQQLTRCLDVAVPAEITGKYRAGDIRHCFADISAGAARARLQAALSLCRRDCGAGGLAALANRG